MKFHIRPTPLQEVKRRYPQLPEKYYRMAWATIIDPPHTITKEALDMYFMAVTYLGGPAWSDMTLSRALAWALCTGFTEACVLSKIHIALIMASYRFALRGSCVPDFDLMRETLIPAVQDLMKHQNKTEWLEPLMQRYDITGWEKCQYGQWFDKSEKKFFGVLKKVMRFFIQKGAK